jgi:hypothetical protein
MIVKTQNAKYYFMLVFSFLTNCKILHPLHFIVLIIIILVIIILLLQINQDLSILPVYIIPVVFFVLSVKVRGDSSFS